MAPHSSTLAWKIPWTEVCNTGRGEQNHPKEKEKQEAKAVI